jgi:hypothetical protein
MRRVAVINGKPVYSDKQVADIVNTRINFTDGSWCDVGTGEVVNRGPGSIVVGDLDGEVDEAITGPERFTARSLELRNLDADVRVEVHSSNTLDVLFEGFESGVAAIRSFVDSDTLIIEGKDER